MPIKHNNNITLILVFLMIFISGTAQKRPLVFDGKIIEDPQIQFLRLTTDNGLSHNRITDLVQDNSGFVWIATTDGLNRYDGNSFEIYRHNEDNFTSLSSSFVTCIAKNKAGELFIGTDNGLNKYDPKSNSFELIPIDNFNRNPSIRQLLAEKDSILWIESNDGYLIKFNTDNNKLLSSYKHNTVYQQYYLYHDIYRDSEGILWIGMRNREPMYLDEVENKIVKIEADKDDLTKKRAVDMACYYEDSYGNFWFTALDGIYLYHRTTNEFRKFLGTTTYDVVEDDNNNIWFATGSGIMRYDVKKNEITLMENEKDNPNSVSSNNIYKIFVDNIGNLWFGTGNGVNIYKNTPYPFNHFTHIPGIENSPEGFEVTAVAEDDKNNLWIGYQNDGLDYFDRKSRSFKHYLENEPPSNSLASNKVSALYFDKQHRLWIGLWRGIGFNMLNTVNNKFSFYTYNPETLEKDWYADFAEDMSGNFYIGFWGADGLTGFDRDKGVFLNTFKNKFERVNCSRLITDLKLSRNNTLWFGTTDCGIHKYIPNTDSGVSYFADSEKPRGLLSNKITSIDEDNEGNIWFTSDQLYKYNSKADTFISYGFSKGLGITELNSVVCDNDGYIWIGTATLGIFRYDKVNDVFNNFVKEDGLQSNSFTKAALKLKSGEIIMGCSNGFILFEPSKIVENEKIPTPSFGRLFVHDHIFSHDLNEDDYFELEPDENVFTVELMSSDVVNLGRYSYQCMLVGYDKEWVDVDSRQRKIRYASVPPGKYVLKYRLGNRNSKWSEKIAAITFKINKPYYKTIWFIMSSIALIVLIVILVIKQREFDLKQKNRNIELQQKLFRLQMNPHFIYNSLLAIQNYMFSHKPDEAGNYLSDFARLFRLILNNSKSEFIQISKEIETLNLYLKLQTLRYPGKFSFDINIDPEIDPEMIMIPPMLAQPMIENALEHGLFYKKGHGHIIIKFNYTGKNLLFEVEDNGVGLSKTKDIQKLNKDHVSSALDITKERIKILGKRYGFFAIFEINEIIGREGEVQGTRVKFNLPIKFAIDELY